MEVTTEDYVTLKGDCIIAVRADKSAFTLSEEVKEALRTEGSTVKAIIEVGGLREEVIGRGSRRLLLTSTTSLVFRRSYYVDPRTVMIGADKAAVHLSRNIVKLLKDPLNTVTIILEVEV